MKKACFLILLTVITLACNNENNIIISGNHPDSTQEYLYVNSLNLNKPVLVDSVKIKPSGKFKIEIKNTEPSLYTLGYDNNEFVTLVAEPGDRIKLQFKSKKLQNDYTVEGSEESEKVRILDKKLGRTIIILDSLTTEYEAISEKEGNPGLAAEIEEEYANILTEQRKYNIGFILDNLSKLSAVKALYQKINENTFVLYQQRDLQYLKLVSDSLSKYYPGISLTKSLKENLDDEINRMYVDRITKAAENLTPVNLDANLKDLSGKRVRLSELTKNNYVLLSFWSAESKECISNNLFLKQMYRLYHKQGFEIYQVNLDSDEALWKSSVKFDELPWVNVREDDPSDPVTARMFNVSSLPANYLLDTNGEIIGKDLFGRSLKIKLGQIFD
ncbi:MAG: thioredoxin-like domain-containing protein [Bacteroidota bacterium]